MPLALEERPTTATVRPRVLQLTVFGDAFHVIRGTGAPIALGPATHYCPECCEDVTPIPLSDVAQGWIPFPCHQTECVSCFDYETHCHTCDQCEECCECSFCNRCSETVTESLCSSCSDCPTCCECYVCGGCEYRDCYGESMCFDCDRCDTCCTCSRACTCESEHQHFSFPANGEGTVASDEFLTAASPAGLISKEGMRAIATLVSQHVPNGYAIAISLEPVWQTKRGNFPRRLSSELHRKSGAKLPAEILSAIGNLARAHTSGERSNLISFTRQLNLSAEDFYNDESCWWGSHSFSRCSFKELGGIGMRTFSEHDKRVMGRAWIQPLDSEMMPTDDAINAHAYVVYNGYGNLSGYEPCRIIAHLTGRTYAKVDLYISGQYVNGEKGYLVADQATCEATTEISIDGTVDHA